MHTETTPLQRNLSNDFSASSPPANAGSGFEDVSLDPESADPHSAPLVSRTRATSNMTSSSRRAWGDAPTYLEAMSSPAFAGSAAEAEGGVPPPRTPALRERASVTFRGLFHRAAVTFAPAQRAGPSRPGGLSTEMIERRNDRRYSSTSLLLQPQTSRISSIGSTPLTRSTSPSRSPWASTQSLGLQISSPVPNTALRASFDVEGLPRAGLSDDQMRFLSSSEAVNLVGVKLGDVPPGKRRRRSTAGEGSAPAEGVGAPPTWDESQGESSRRSMNDDEENGTTIHRDTASTDAEPETTNQEQNGAPPLDSAVPTSTASATISSPPTVEIAPPTPITPNAPS